MEKENYTELDLGINLGINATLECLIEAGILIELDSNLGYNGVTKPEGLSGEILKDSIDDFIFNAVRKSIEDDVAEKATDIIMSELGAA